VGNGVTVYVDQGRYRYRRMIMCHMLSDSIDELHEMAEEIGMLRRWYQPFSFPHYDVASNKRELAIKHGAIELDRYGVVDLMRRLRSDPEFLAAWRASLGNHA
jgi:Protein of unknown function (DUF4031)